jgi:ubiquinone/menaquinone biosynthesis C-methylase UbiE
MPVEDEQIRSRILQTLGEVRRVLDVGCGNCALVQFLAHEIAQEAVGIDIHGTSAHEHVPAASDGKGGTARCLQMDAQDMEGWEEGHFDAVVSTHALHEIADPDAALREMRRVLRQGGTLLIADFTLGESRWNERYFTPAQARAMLQRAGFTNVAVEEVRGEHFMFAIATK